MKRFKAAILFTLVFAFILGCADAGSLLSESQEEFSDGLSEYELMYDGEIPQSVLDTLDFMLENYTDGVSIEEPEEIELDEQGQKDLIDRADEEIESRDELIQYILMHLKETNPDISFKISADLFTNELLSDVIFLDIGGNYIIDAMGYNGYSYSYVEGTEWIPVSLKIGYNFPIDEIKMMKQATAKKANELVEELNLKNLSSYEKVAAVNKYLCDTAEYSTGKSPYKPVQHSAYGALINGDCVCEGYAKAAQLLFSLCGVESIYVLGGVEVMYDHCWNLIKLDGQYYQMDITWNDADKVHPNQYFLVTDDYMRLSRDWDRSKYPKSANKPYPKRP